MHVCVLGTFRVEIGGTPVPTTHWRLRKARTLVAMLALAPGQRLHRDQIIDRLWPELDARAGSHGLHQALYVARRALAGAGSHEVLAVQHSEVLLCSDCTVEVDALTFERAAVAALATHDTWALRAALDLDGGDLLTDQTYEDWFSDRRATLKVTRHALRIRLAECLARSGSADEAMAQIDQVLTDDAVHEGAVRAAMTLLTEGGRRSEALARYERLRDDLLDRFGTDPDEQTATLFRRLLTEVEPRPSAAVRGRWPSPLTHFVPRPRDLDEIEALLGSHRLTTLTGAGGCGKTRLAVEAGRRTGGHHPDGVWFIDLAALNAPRLLPVLVATALDLTPGSGSDATRAVIEQLQARAALIVLDNCEHLLPAVAELAQSMLTGCPRLTMLATSREPLGVAGEVTFRVPSLDLPVPAGSMHLDLEALVEVGSVALFLDRARLARPGFTVDAGNAEGVIDVCRRVDGIPLALELAAARAKVLEPAEIAARLGDVLSLLTGPLETTRHETLHAALGWSHGLLPATDQALLRRMSVFSGSFDLAAVEAVCLGAPLESPDLIAALGRLVDKSLVLTEPAPRACDTDSSKPSDSSPRSSCGRRASRPTWAWPTATTT